MKSAPNIPKPIARTTKRHNVQMYGLAPYFFVCFIMVGCKTLDSDTASIGDIDANNYQTNTANGGTINKLSFAYMANKLDLREVLAWRFYDVSSFSTGWVGFLGDTNRVCQIKPVSDDVVEMVSLNYTYDVEYFDFDGHAWQGKFSVAMGYTPSICLNYLAGEDGSVVMSVLFEHFCSHSYELDGIKFRHPQDPLLKRIILRREKKE